MKNVRERNEIQSVAGGPKVPLIPAVPRVQPQQKAPIKPQSWRRKQCLAVEQEGLCFNMGDVVLLMLVELSQTIQQNPCYMLI